MLVVEILKNAWRFGAKSLLLVYLKKTDYVIFGDEAGNKYDKTIELNVQTLTRRWYEKYAFINTNKKGKN